MAVLLLGLLLAAIVAFAGPTVLPQQARSPLADNTLRIIGVLGMLFAIASTSFVWVPDGHLGQLFRVYGGGSLSEGRIVALDGENGPQASILTPGFHPWLLVDVLYGLGTRKLGMRHPERQSWHPDGERRCAPAIRSGFC